MGLYRFKVMSRITNIWNAMRGRHPNAKKFYVCKTYVENKENGFKGMCNLKFYTRDRVINHCKRFNHSTMKIKVEWY